MTTLEKIRAEIIKEYGDNVDDMSWSYRAGLAKALDIINEYAEQDKLMIIEANVNGYTQGLKDAQRQSCENCKQDPKECGNDAHYGFCQNWEYAEQEPCDDVVSREAVKELIKSGISTDTYEDIELVCKWVDEMPPVRHQLCDDAISREWLKTAIHNFYYGLKHTPTEEDIQAYIDVAPSVRPQEPQESEDKK